MRNIFFIFIAFLLNIGLSFAQTCDLGTRPSVTFILGEDQSDSFYTLAKQYYLTDREAQTDYFVDTCRSLVGVRNFLAAQGLENGQTWGQINLVLHSNQWTGMSIPVLPNGNRTSVSTLFAHIQEEQFLPLADEMMDVNTKMNFVSCGLGKNKDLLYALQLAFGGFDEQQPSVESSENFVYFTYDDRQKIESTNLKPFYAFYKTAYKPADLHLQKQLQNRYPNIPIDWLAAMQLEQAEKEGDVFHTRFNVPIVWDVAMEIPADRVSIESEFDKIEFVRAQEDLMEMLRKFDIPIEKFRWQMSVTEKAGVAQVKIKGKSTVLCVLAEI